MKPFLKFGIINILLITILSSCTSTQESEPEGTSNLSWQNRIMNKFTFHTKREHEAMIKAQEEFERKQYLAKKKAEKLKKVESKKSESMVSSSE